MVFVPVPIGDRYTATARGKVIKAETCETCGTKFVYLMKREAKAYGVAILGINGAGAETRAASSAVEDLAAKLERENDLVPCPSCGRFQKRMVKRRRRRNILILLVSLAVYFLAFPALVPLDTEIPAPAAPPDRWIIQVYPPKPERIPNRLAQVFYLSGLGAGVCLGIWMLTRNYNAKPEKRAGRPAPNVMLKWQYEQRKLAGEDVEEIMGRQRL